MNLHFTKKERYTLSALLAVPVLLTTLLTYPSYHAFNATGDIVPISELGIDGHVYFTYIQGGITANNLEKIAVQIRYLGKDVHFEPVSREYAQSDDEREMISGYYKDMVVSNAIEVAGFSPDETADQDEKYEHILELASEYHGDSFGLMVAIGLVEEELGEDFSRGGKYKIAGTGTMEFDGMVGSIDGVHEKLLTAEEHGVTHFLLPKDKESYYEYYEGVSNQEEAEQYQRSRNPDMQIVPVETLDEALDYLRRLP
ncbi:S16 family serine protease [Brevibacillus sp. TJ4]|uniref:S16 family serine protease n=1 Tax=Brevibacillus sp. TJ4 TaxID=3234853 RepID=UPI0037D6A9AD